MREELWNTQQWENQMVCELGWKQMMPLLNWRISTENTVEVWKYKLNKKLKGSWKLSLLREGFAEHFLLPVTVTASRINRRKEKIAGQDISGDWWSLQGNSFAGKEQIFIALVIIFSAHPKTQKGLAQNSINKSSHKPSDLSPKFRSVLEATMSIKIISCSSC